jgi:hypothetical protein
MAEVCLSHPPGILITMTEQLTLVAVERAEWEVDRRTREVGRRGIAAARALLDKPPHIDDPLERTAA